MSYPGLAGTDRGLVAIGDALAMAVTRRPPVGFVHHCDRGSQYTSLAFGKTLRESGLVASMVSRGDAYDNAACESCISTLKREWIKQHRHTSRVQYIETFYNPRRPHSEGSAPTSTEELPKQTRRTD